MPQFTQTELPELITTQAWDEITIARSPFAASSRYALERHVRARLRALLLSDEAYDALWWGDGDHDWSLRRLADWLCGPEG